MQIPAASVTVDVRGPGDVQSHAGAYLIGADGGRSIVRKPCGIAFEGFTWPERFIVLTTPLISRPSAAIATRSYFADPGAWCNCFKVSADGPPGLWRTVYPTDPAAIEDDVMSDDGVQARHAVIFSVADALRDRASQSLCDAPARGRDVPQGPGAAGRRCRARQQSDRRHGAEWRPAGRRQSGRQARAA